MVTGPSPQEAREAGSRPRALRPTWKPCASSRSLRSAAAWRSSIASSGFAWMRRLTSISSSAASATPRRGCSPSWVVSRFRRPTLLHVMLEPLYLGVSVAVGMRRPLGEEVARGERGGEGDQRAEGDQKGEDEKAARHHVH